MHAMHSTSYLARSGHRCLASFSPSEAAGIRPARRPGPARGLLVALALGSVLTSLSAVAAPPPGRLLASQCFQCHGTQGQAVSGFESISGKSANEMYKELLEMSQRRPEGIMDYQARAYTPAQLRLIASYLSTISKTGVARRTRD